MSRQRSLEWLSQDDRFTPLLSGFPVLAGKITELHLETTSQLFAYMLLLRAVEIVADPTEEMGADNAIEQIMQDWFVLEKSAEKWRAKDLTELGEFWVHETLSSLGQLAKDSRILGDHLFNALFSDLYDLTEPEFRREFARLIWEQITAGLKLIAGSK
jgi:hypothetical protein